VFFFMPLLLFQVVSHCTAISLRKFARLELCEGLIKNPTIARRRVCPTVYAGGH
jgi:hypothetical protein